MADITDILFYQLRKPRVKKLGLKKIYTRKILGIRQLHEKQQKIKNAADALLSSLNKVNK